MTDEKPEIREFGEPEGEAPEAQLLDEEVPESIFVDCVTVHSVLATFAGFCVALGSEENKDEELLGFGLDSAMARIIDIMGLEPDEFGYEWNPETKMWEA